jgi:alanine racemase
MSALALPLPAATSRPTLTIDHDALAANVRLFARRTSADLMAVVKADGFGHGAETLARVALANGATRLGVTSLDEAFALRSAGIAAPVLSWLNPVDADFAGAAAQRIEVAVPSLEHLAALAPGTDVHLQLDAGMARDGASPQVFARLCRAAAQAERRGRIQVVGVMGHLGCADDRDDPCNTLGRERFAWAVGIARANGLRPRLRHLAATAATLTDARTHHTMVRVGAGLVGIDPSGTTPLHPAMTLTAPVVGIRDVPAGTYVGYGHAHETSRATRLALLPLGYADGLPRPASDRAEVQLGGRRCPVVGRISMDQVVVDIGDLPVGVGASAVVFGPGSAGEPTVADWADWAGTLPHEIVTGLGARLHRSTTPMLRSLR